MVTESERWCTVRCGGTVAKWVSVALLWRWHSQPWAGQISLNCADFDCASFPSGHGKSVDLDEEFPSEERIGDLPCWVIVQIPALLSCLDLEIDWGSFVGELILTLATDALQLPDEQCMTVRQCLSVVQVLSGHSVWDSPHSADGGE